MQSIPLVQKFKIYMKNPRIGTVVEGQLQYDSLMEAHRAAENWKAANHLPHWHVVIKDQRGITVADDSRIKQDYEISRYPSMARLSKQP